MKVYGQRSIDLEIFLQRFAQNAFELLNTALTIFFHLRIFVFEQLGQERNGFRKQWHIVFAQFRCKRNANFQRE